MSRTDLIISYVALAFAVFFFTMIAAGLSLTVNGHQCHAITIRGWHINAECRL